MKRWMIVLAAATTGCGDDCADPSWTIDLSFVHLQNVLVFSPLDRDPSGTLTMLVHPNFDHIRVGDEVISEPQIVRVDTNGRITAKAPAPDGRASSAAVSVRVNDAGAVLLAWATETSITLAMHGPELDRRWAYGISAAGITQLGAEFHIDIGPSGEAVLLSHDVNGFERTLTVIDPMGAIRWTQSLPSNEDNLAITFSPEGDLFELATSFLGPVRKRRAGATGVVLDELALPQEPAIVESDGGYYIVGPFPSAPRLARAGRFDAAGGQRWLLDLGETNVTDATRAGTGDLVVTTSSDSGETQALHVFDGATGTLKGEAPYCAGNLIAADADAYTAVTTASGSRVVIARYPLPSSAR